MEFFLKKYAEENGRPTPRITPEALRPLMAYSWPGNVRELENVIERAVVLSSGPEISMDLLPDSMMGRGSSLTLHDPPSDASLFEIVEDVERRDHYRHARTLQLEPDRSRRALPRAALHAEPENPAAEY